MVRKLNTPKELSALQLKFHILQICIFHQPSFTLQCTLFRLVYWLVDVAGKPKCFSLRASFLCPWVGEKKAGRSKLWKLFVTIFWILQGLQNTCFSAFHSKTTRKLYYETYNNSGYHLSFIRVSPAVQYCSWEISVWRKYFKSLWLSF